jgi:hypothetical protein
VFTVVSWSAADCRFSGHLSRSLLFLYTWCLNSLSRYLPLLCCTVVLAFLLLIVVSVEAFWETI